MSCAFDGNVTVRALSTPTRDATMAVEIQPPVANSPSAAAVSSNLVRVVIMRLNAEAHPKVAHGDDASAGHDVDDPLGTDLTARSNHELSCRRLSHKTDTSRKIVKFSAKPLDSALGTERAKNVTGF